MTDDRQFDASVRFSIVPEWVVDHRQSGLSANAVRLYALIDRYGNSESAVADPGRAHLAERLGMSVDTLDRAKGELEECGALLVERRHNRPNVYVLQREPSEKSAARMRLAEKDGRTDAASSGRTDAAQQIAPTDRDTSANAPVSERAATDVSQTAMPLSGEGVTATVTDKPGRPDYVGHFVNEVRRVADRDPLDQARARVGRDARNLERGGAEPELILAAITEVVEAGLMVGALCGVADQLSRGGYRGFHRGPAGGRGGSAGQDVAAEQLGAPSATAAWEQVQALGRHLPQWEPCAACDGSGYANVDEETDCPTCNGSGRHDVAQRPDVHPYVQRAVDACGGVAAIGRSDNPQVSRAHFRDSYRDVLAEALRDRTPTEKLAGAAHG